MQEVYGFSAEVSGSEGSFLAYTVDHLFGDVWCRPALSIAERRLITIGVLAAQGQHDLLELQFSAAMDRGELSEEQVREVVLHLAHYVGFGLGAGANNSAERAIARRQGP
jgi:4-carboxymuconolactone decarboxylase